MYIVFEEKMMSAAEILFGLAIFFVICFVFISILIVVALNKRKIRTNFLWLRLFLFKYVNQYKKVTLAEAGKVGSLFYLWILSINLALVCAIAGLIMKSVM